MKRAKLIAMVMRPSEKTPIKPNFCLWRNLRDLMMKKGIQKTVDVLAYVDQPDSSSSICWSFYSKCL